MQNPIIGMWSKRKQTFSSPRVGSCPVMCQRVTWNCIPNERARQPQTVCETGAMLRQPDRDPSVKRGDTKRGIKLAQMVGRLSSLIYSSGKRMTSGDDKQYERKAWQLPEGLFRPR